MMKLENLYPERVFYYFEKLTEIPHGSRNTKQISDYLVSFAKEHGLKYYQDESNNVIIVKEATAGYENADTIIIQGHMDMVCEKENGCNIDFTKDSLDIFIDGDFVKAKGTTLGGLVVVQVERVVKAGHLDPKLVKIPGIYVDAVVECPADDPKQSQSINCTYDPAYAGNTQVPVSSLEPKKLDAKKIIGRRAAMELKKNVVVNLGVGVPEWVSSVAAEEGVADEMTLTVECGPVGGVPGGGLRFGGSVNAQAYMDEGYQFDFYDGGGLDLCFLGLAEVDINGDVNVSRLGTRITGSGGFTNISSNSKKAVFCGTFTNGVKIQTGDGKLTILEEGKKHKFVNKVTEITFSGVVAGKAGKDVLYVTERAVFALKADGIHLIEVAPGIDVQTQVLDEMDFAPIVDRDADGNVKLMDARIFKDEVMGMTIE